MEKNAKANRDSATEIVLPSRLLPRVSFQTMLVLTAIAAVLIAVVYAADQGGVYAKAAAVGMSFLAGMALVLTAMFLVSWSISFIPKLVGGVMIAIGLVLSPFALMGLPATGFLFLLKPVWILNLLLVGLFLLVGRIGEDGNDQAESPFADEQLPPQILAPREPVN